MPWAFFLIIAAIWALFLLPPMMVDRFNYYPRSRGERTSPSEHTEPLYASSPGASDVTFDTPAGESDEAYRRLILARRRRALVLLLLAVVATLVAAIVARSLWMLGLHLAVDGMLAGYIVALRKIKERQSVASLHAFPETEYEMSIPPEVRIVQSR